MAVPKKKTSKSKSKMRKATWKSVAFKYFTNTDLQKKLKIDNFALKPTIDGFHEPAKIS